MGNTCILRHIIIENNLFSQNMRKYMQTGKNNATLIQNNKIGHHNREAYEANKKPIHFRMGLRISEYPKSINFSFSDSRD